MSRSQNAPGLTIGTVAGRTGVSVPVLRAWEKRYGFPVPMRSASGHRRYREHDVDLIARVVRDRAAGLSLEAAISRVRDRHDGPASSIFAGLRRYGSDLPVHLVTKVSMLAISRAIEDECCARADRPVLVAAFQRERHFRQSEQRWRDLSRTAGLAVVLAEFPAPGNRPSSAAPSLLEIPLASDAPLLREWAVVCDAPESAAVLAGRERPGRDGRADRDRLFEATWSVEPTVVRQAARVGIQLARRYHAAAGGASGPAAALQRVADELDADPAPDPLATARRAVTLANRIVAYVEADIAGVRREWEAEISEQHPDERVAWHATGGTANAGAVTFHRLDDSKTRVMLQLEFDPEGVAEQVGDKLGFVRRRARGDLGRFKEFIERQGRETGAWRGDVETPNIR